MIKMVVAAEMFPADGTAPVRTMLLDYFAGNQQAGHVCVIDEAEGQPVAVAYYAPEPADRTWNMIMIAVQPEQQGQGRGAALMQYAEHDLQAKGQRLLIVETSGLPMYDRTRAFYRKCGYDEEARIRDYWTTGDDKIVFRKLLTVE